VSMLVTLALAGSAQAIQYHFPVTTTADTNTGPCDPTTSGPPLDPTCSLREAIAGAHIAGSGNGFVDIPPGTYTLTIGRLDVTKGITIASTDGPRATRISGGHNSQVFAIANTSTSTPAKLQGLTIADGAGNAQTQGGGVSITGSGPVQISDSAIVDNHIDGVGAGIFLGPAGNLTVERSLIAHNSTPLGGGGLYLRHNQTASSGSHAVIVNSTFAHNSASDGSAVYAQAGIVANQGDGIAEHRNLVQMDNVTVARNSSSNGAMLTGQAGQNGEEPGQIYPLLTIIADPEQGATCGPAPTIADRGFNLETSNACGLSPANADSVNANPVLGPLEDNGGPTDTMALGNGSDAIDRFFSDYRVEQRGLDRDTFNAIVNPQGHQTPNDMGAYEAIQTADLGVSGTGLNVEGTTITYTLTVSSATIAGNPPDVAQPRVHDALPAGTELVSAIPSQGACTGTTAVDCTLGRLANGSSATVTVTVHSAGAGSFVNSATVSSPRFDANPANDSATQSALVSAPAASGGAIGDAVSPALTSLALSPAKFRAQGSGPSVAKAKGTRVSYTLSESSTVSFKVQQKRAGRKVGKRCVKPAKKNRGKHKCKRTVTLGSFSRASAAGANRFHFTGRVKGRKLKPGAYLLVGTAKDAAGNRSTAVSKAFRVIR
jgi:CSLREA domain-containing protein